VRAVNRPLCRRLRLLVVSAFCMQHQVSWCFSTAALETNRLSVLVIAIDSFLFISFRNVRTLTIAKHDALYKHGELRQQYAKLCQHYGELRHEVMMMVVMKAMMIMMMMMMVMMMLFMMLMIRAMTSPIIMVMGVLKPTT
jgi:hypothetical protein